MATSVHPATSMPSVAGMPRLRLRPFRGLDIDIPGSAAASLAARGADGEVEPIDTDEKRTADRHNQHCDPDRSPVGLRDPGADRAAPVVVLQNLDQAPRLYESNGFRVASPSTDWRKPLVLEGSSEADPSAVDTDAAAPAGAVR